MTTTIRHDPIPLYPPLCFSCVATQLTPLTTGPSRREATRAKIPDRTPDLHERRPMQPTPGSTLPPPSPRQQGSRNRSAHECTSWITLRMNGPIFSLSLSSLYPPPLVSLRYTTCIYYYTRLRLTTHPPTHDSSPACLYQSCGSSCGTYCLP